MDTKDRDRYQKQLLTAQTDEERAAAWTAYMEALIRDGAKAHMQWTARVMRDLLYEDAPDDKTLPDRPPTLALLASAAAELPGKHPQYEQRLHDIAAHIETMIQALARQYHGANDRDLQDRESRLATQQAALSVERDELTAAVAQLARDQQRIREQVHIARCEERARAGEQARLAIALNRTEIADRYVDALAKAERARTDGYAAGRAEYLAELTEEARAALKATAAETAAEEAACEQATMLRDATAAFNTAKDAMRRARDRLQATIDESDTEALRDRIGELESDLENMVSEDTYSELQSERDELQEELDQARDSAIPCPRCGAPLEPGSPTGLVCTRCRDEYVLTAAEALLTAPPAEE